MYYLFNFKFLRLKPKFQVWKLFIYESLSLVYNTESCGPKGPRPNNKKNGFVYSPRFGSTAQL